ncbi:MAG: desulfoferrodoxin family protein [Thiohalospira sp.]
MKKKSLTTSIIAFFVIMLLSFNASADETSVKIKAPEKAEKNSEVTIKIEVTHDGNSFLHHTNWVWVKVNGTEYKKWEYGGFSKPDDEYFTLEFKMKIKETTTIEAKGNCNMHGSKGSEKVKIIVQ